MMQSFLQTQCPKVSGPLLGQDRSVLLFPTAGTSACSSGVRTQLLTAPRQNPGTTGALAWLLVTVSGA